MTSLLKIERSPRRGLMTLEWVMLAYMALTTLLMFFMYTKLQNPESMLWGRMRILFITLAMWGVYRLVPCRLTTFARIAVQMALLSWWYPDTYEFNRLFPNLDHLFATWEQSLFGCQPALHFHSVFSWKVFSELMHLGYSAYYPMIAVVVLYCLLCKYDMMERAATVIMTSFFVYYIIYIAIPVAGPQYYFLAAGMDNIAAGVFPDVNNYFLTHCESLPLPGWNGGFFYDMVQSAHDAGERPTAAFPSSHVGVSTIVMLLAWKTGSRRLLYCLLPLYVLLCFSTVYIQAHYAIDVLGGWVSGAMLFFTLWFALRLR